MKTKILLWSVALILIIGLAVAAIWWMCRPQVITFSDDSKVTLLAVEYGKHHAPPNIKASITSTNKAPARGRGSFTTTEDTLVVWVREEYETKQYHYFQFFAYDKAETACVGNFMTHSPNSGRRGGNDVVGIEFNAFPRRQGKFLVGVQENGNGGQEMADQKFVISNPARGPFTKWTAESLPTTREDDDVSVTLNKLVSGADMTYQRNQDNLDDPINKGVQAVFQVQRSGKTVSNWQPVSIVTTDATGNQVSGGPNTQWNSDEGTTTYQWGLWPDELAWKIKFEFSQQFDFADSELWNVQNLPVLPGKQQEMYNNAGNRRQTSTNPPFTETDLNGFHLKLFPAKEFTDAGQNNWMQGGLFIEASPAVADGWRMTVKVTDTQTNDIQSSEYNTMRNNNISSYRFRLQDISGLTNLNVSIALHKSRFVEFTAKPEKGVAAPAQ